MTAAVALVVFAMGTAEWFGGPYGGGPGRISAVGGACPAPPGCGPLSCGGCCPSGAGAPSGCAIVSLSCAAGGSGRLSPSGARSGPRSGASRLARAVLHFARAVPRLVRAAPSAAQAVQRSAPAARDAVLRRAVRRPSGFPRGRRSRSAAAYPIRAPPLAAPAASGALHIRSRERQVPPPRRASPQGLVLRQSRRGRAQSRSVRR